MRAIRQRPPAPKLTGGMCADEAWAAAPCANPAAAFMWDLDIDGNGRWERVETPAQRRDRHAEAKRMCRECPALALCQQLPTDGLQGVVAGRVIR